MPVTTDIYFVLVGTSNGGYKIFEWKGMRGLVKKNINESDTSP